MRIAKGCKGWIIIPIIFTIFFLFFSIYIHYYFFVCFILSSFVSVFFIIFFRDPNRITGKDIVSPADGKIREIQIDKTVCFISIFMDIYNVHVNRMPIDGTIINITHFPGKHFKAFTKESDMNERVEIDIESKIGRLKVIQIAGLIARRICPYIEKGDTLKKGDKIGIIRLGSRVDIYLPSKFIKRITVDVKSKVYSGVTTIAELK
jgi:phosphatidylserine decarboxylase